jgi:hypothetical protein
MTKTRHKNKNITKKNKTTRKQKSGKKWTTAIDAAQKTLSKTGSLSSAQASLRKQSLINARKLFGSISAFK